MPSNAEAAEIFRSIADLLDVLGERFKPEAYRRAARSIETLAEDLGAVAARNELGSIPGVGEAIGEKIREYLATGTVHYYERLKHEVPPGVVELLRLPGLGPKTARRFWVELGVEGPAELATAIEAGRLTGVKGFGEKKIDQIRAALAAARAAPRSGHDRAAIESVYPVAERIVQALRAVPGTERAEAAGSFRRCRESVGDLDILVTSTAPENVFDAFTALPDVREVRVRGPTKETVVLASGLQVDLRVVEPAAFGAALQYFTGSKDHNVHLRSIARARGLKVNEYGVFRDDERVAGRTEEEVYGALGLAWIPPELREDLGEIDLAARGPLPPLVAREDLVAEFHVHLPPTASPSAVDRLVAEARSRRLSFLGVVVGEVDADGHARSLPPSTVRRLGAASGEGLTVARAIETGLGPRPEPFGRLAADYRILRPTSSEPAAFAPPTDRPEPLVIAHLGAEGTAPETVRRWIDLARAASAAVEVGPGPERLDSTWARTARESGVRLALPSGLGRPPEDPTAAIALGFARRAAAGASAILHKGPPSAPSRSGT